jgi:hypothetical protein
MAKPECTRYPLLVQYVRTNVALSIRLSIHPSVMDEYPTVTPFPSLRKSYS